MPLDSAIAEKARRIRLVLTDNDGVLTDGGVYYGEHGEVFKRFCIRDGMGVERLRNLCNVQVGIVTGEVSPSVKTRAKKLKIEELHLGIKDKPALLAEIVTRLGITPEQVAFIGDDVNDVEIMRRVGLAATPADGTRFAKEVAHIITEAPSGNGAFRELAELIIEAQTANDTLA